MRPLPLLLGVLALPSAVSAQDLVPPALLSASPVQVPAGVQAADRVVVRVRVDSLGAVVRAEAEPPGDPKLDSAVVAAVRTWRFAPARLGERPVPYTVRLPVRVSVAPAAPDLPTDASADASDLDGTWVHDAPPALRAASAGAGRGQPRWHRVPGHARAARTPRRPRADAPA